MTEIDTKAESHSEMFIQTAIMLDCKTMLLDKYSLRGSPLDSAK